MSLTSEALSSALDPPPFDPVQPSIPISYPLKTIQELESRAYFKSFHYPFNKSSVPLKSSVLDDRPRILVCHDMQGGYVDDKWVQGGKNESAYAIWHWYLIDIFVYFSHNLVTLPPPCWTNTAHRHGVKVLGTFITEGSDGIETCNKLLATKESAQMYAERLAELAADLGFDGWLMNIEVSLDPSQIPNLKEFISHLTETMHSSVPGSLVIWYDSVTITGELSYQNQLNERNKPFFDICDGIFANYWWEEDYPKLSAAVAGDRKYDVYMGIDVFGRGTYGGGEWNTNVALDVCKKDDVSAVLFAPGWVYETKQPPDFQTAQNKAMAIIFLLKEGKSQMLLGIIYLPKAFRPKPEIGKLSLEHKSDGHNDKLAQGPSEYFAVLGHITIKTSKDNPVFPPSSSWLVEGQYIKWSSGSQGSKSLNVKIAWKLKDGSNFQSSKYNIYVEKLAKTTVGNSGGRVEGIQEYIGVAYVEAFYVYDLSIPSTTTTLKFIIQVCGVDGASQKLDDSPYYQLDVEASNHVTIPIRNYGEMTSSRRLGLMQIQGEDYYQAQGLWDT
ncbi:hypothetical protein GH714_013772 [Hevea brasiliensis]|uniref:mannosyl-glycoprotein endo-beta-N-acetylglucosaminidase n=1 Tax=Hevea brasiliensis TaxID=3981 RepID=A0A6A6N187_HEVBR|nr:hypothetical protein GH714_013772 [Hevea brasiliensis]